MHVYKGVNMFKRKIYDVLVEWRRKSNAKTALLIEGARRVGKTTIATNLGKNEFDNYCLIDFSKLSDDTLSLFNEIPPDKKLDMFFGNLFLSVSSKVLPKGSLIIFDEIQFCPKARQAIKHLVADGRYYYIETGSLVSIKENTKNILIPSEERSIEMLPMDFEEFLWAINDDYSLDAIKRIKDNYDIASEEKFHHQFMKLFKLYMAIGGMPQAINTYIETNDLLEVHKTKMDIINLYEKDLYKIDNNYKTICKIIWDLMPSMLSNHSSRFVVSSLNIESDSVLLKHSIEKLKESKMIYYVPSCTQPKLGMKLTEQTNSFKLYFNDVGLFTAIVFNDEGVEKESIYHKLIFSKLNADLGMVYENIICQILESKSYNPYYCTWSEIKDDKKKYYEIDFLISKNATIVPIEVKKSKNYSTSSLDLFIEKYGIKLGIVLSPTALSKKDKIYYLPLYMSYLI